MNILGVMGSIGFDANVPYLMGDIGDFWSHGSGATLIMDGKLKAAMNEERFSRIKHDGNFPKLAIQHILDHNKLTNEDIDLVVYVTAGTYIAFQTIQSGFYQRMLKEWFPNCQAEFIHHHTVHASATFFTSGFDEANILTFDGAGDHELQDDGTWFHPHMKFLQGKDRSITEVFTCHVDKGPMHTGFGIFYDSYCHQVYRNKMIQMGKTPYVLEEQQKHLDPRNRESFPGKVMGLSAFGDYRKIDLPEWFTLARTQRYLNGEWESELPILVTEPIPDVPHQKYSHLDPDDLAAWVQHQFEKYLLLLLSNIPENLKHDNLCLGGGSALNILTNSKIIEQGIYKNVHVNTAPNDDGLHFGAAVYKSVEKEGKVILPEDIGYLGITYTDEEIEAVL